jgi:hypothetical protein
MAPKSEKKSGNSEVSERIWAIRDDIQKLEDLKDQIVAYFDTHPDLDTSERKLWIGDAKEAYYSVVAAWQMLDACQQEDRSGVEDPAASAKQFLNNALSGVNQSASELRCFKDTEGPRLEGAWTQAFERCQQAILRELAHFLAKQEVVPPPVPIIKVRDQEYHLPCSVCGKISVIIRVGVPVYSKDLRLVYEGITHSTGYDLQDAKDVFALLSAGNLKGLHQLFKDRLVYEGIDAYCPECDKIYCRDHYNAVENYDDGFYDDTDGTCPLGHRRMIDD